MYSIFSIYRSSILAYEILGSISMYTNLCACMHTSDVLVNVLRIHFLKNMQNVFLIKCSQRIENNMTQNLLSLLEITCNIIFIQLISQKPCIQEGSYTLNNAVFIKNRISYILIAQMQNLCKCAINIYYFAFCLQLCLLFSRCTLHLFTQFFSITLLQDEVLVSGCGQPTITHMILSNRLESSQH